jgi:hypothetical protein
MEAGGDIECSNKIDELLVSEEEIQFAIDHPFRPEERAFVQVRMNIATDVGIFAEESNNILRKVTRKNVSRIANTEDVEQYHCWKMILDKIAEHDTEGSVMDNSSELLPSTGGLGDVVEPEVICDNIEVESRGEYLQQLNVEQCMAHSVASTGLQLFFDFLF